MGQKHEDTTLTPRVLTVLAHEGQSRRFESNTVQNDIALLSCILNGSWSVVRGRARWNLSGTGRGFVVRVNVDVSSGWRLIRSPPGFVSVDSA